MGQFAEGLFSDFAQLHQHVQEAEKNFVASENCSSRNATSSKQLKRSERQADSDLEQRLQAQLEEIEKDRKALEEELALVRAEAANMAAKIAEQKQQLADEHAEWADELKQLRRILDKQSDVDRAPKPDSPPQAVPKSRAAAKVGTSVAADECRRANQLVGRRFQPGGGATRASGDQIDRESFRQVAWQPIHRLRRPNASVRVDVDRASRASSL